MDWIKLLFYINGILLFSFLTKAESSKNEKNIKEGKVDFNQKFTNSTRSVQEILQESPSEKFVFRNRSIFGENKNASPVNKNPKISKNKKDQETESAKDLKGEANVYSPVLTFTETPVGDHWHIVPEIFPYTPHYKFSNPIPVIESQSFVNTPKLTYIQKNYKPVTNVQGRNVHSNSEYPEDSNSYSHPESKEHLGPGHAVHTETIHDFGRFLPEEYKSKIEKEAESLIKQKNKDNGTVATATTNRPQAYTRDTQSLNRENRQSARGHPHRRQKSVNTGFFYKGNFESAYPFPNNNDNQDDARHISTSEGYPQEPSTIGAQKPMIPVKIGEPYNHRPGGTPTEMYYRDYSYPSEQDPPHQESPPKDTYYEEIHQRDQYNRDLYHKNQPNYKNKQPVDVHHQDPRKKSIKHNNEPRENLPSAISFDQNHNHKDSHGSTFRQQNQNQDYIRHNDPLPNHTDPPNAPEQYGSPTKAYDPTHPETFEKPVSNHRNIAPYTPQPHSQAEYQNLPPQYHNGENKSPWTYSTEHYKPVTDIPQKDTYSNLSPKPYNPPFYPSKYNKNPELYSDTPYTPLVKNPLQPETGKPYYNTFRSLMDLYKSFGFQPLHIDEMSILPPRFPYENSFYGKIEVSGPATGHELDTDFIRPSKPPTYLTSTNSPRDSNFDNYRDQYSNKNYDNKEIEPSTVTSSGPYSTIKYNNGENGPRDVNYGAPHANMNYNIGESGPSSTNHGLPYSNVKHNSGENYPSSVSYGRPHYDMKYNSRENGPSSVSYGGPHYNMKYNSGEHGPSSVSYGGPHYNMKYNSREHGPSNMNYGGPHYGMKYNSRENGPSSVSSGGPHYNMKYNSRENYRDNSYFKHTSSEGNVKSQYPEHAPYDANPSPTVSTEYYDPPETPQPHHALNTQIETPKEVFKEGEYGFKPYSYSQPTTYSPPGDEKVKGIRIKDYDAETYFGEPQQMNLNNPPESELKSGAYHTNTSLYSHSVVRNNPYNIKSEYSGEVEDMYKPRRYRQKLKIEIDPSVEVSDERPNTFHSNEKTNKFNLPSSAHNIRDGFSSDVQPFNRYNNEYQGNEHGFTRSKELNKPENKNQQRRPNSKRKSKSQQDKDGNSNDGQEYRQSKKKKSSSKRFYEDKFIHSQLDQDYSSPRHRKRSSHRLSRKNRSSNKPDHMRAESSTYHWGMEKHKGTDGFFQYANVPGAKAFEYGYRMGGPKHTRERHHRTIGEQSKIKVNWEDGNGDSGDHYWEFNHNTNQNDDNEDEDDEKEIKSKTKSKPKPKSEESSEESSE